MGDPRVTAVWLTDGWAKAYQGRAKWYGHTMPPDEHKRMMKALSRMYVSEKREDEQLAAIGQSPIWAKAG